MTIYLVRHGQTCWNRDLRLQGQKDSPLTLLGIEQARAFGDCLFRELSDRDYEVHVSTLPRAQQSASIIAERLGFEWERMRHEGRLQERNQGLWDGLNAQEIEAGFSPDPVLRRSWEFAAPEGESMADVQSRVATWLAEHADQGRTIVAVCHGVVSRVMRGSYLKLSPSEILRIPSHPQDRLFRLAEGRVDPLQVAVPAK